MFRHRASLLLLLLSLPLTGCLFRSHRVIQPASLDLRTANKEQLIDIVNSEARKIRTLNATVDIATSVGGAKRGRITEYQEIRGYILVRQPSMLRMIGLLPVIRNRAFDMVSNGSEFRLWIPPKNKFYVGRDDLSTSGATGLASLRPQIIHMALLLQEIDPTEVAVESGQQRVVEPKNQKKEISQEDYRLDVMRTEAQGLSLARRFYFNRSNLLPYRQTTYDGNGNITTDTQYSDWKTYGDVQFPSVIQISRPVEEYQITIGIVKLTVNEPLTDQQFALAQPPGAQVVSVNGGPMASSATEP